MSASPSPSERPVYVYALRSSADQSYRYVGSTVDWRLRRTAHRSAWGAAALNKWRATVKAAGHQVEMDVLEVSTEAEAWAVEMRWMVKLRGEGHPLLNVKKSVAKHWR